MNSKLQSPAPFLLGVNYWPRRTGVRMWKEFDLAEIEQEFAQIHELGMDTVRVFPLWDDFQPIYELPAALNIPSALGMRQDWKISPRTNPAMIDPEMFHKFDQVVELANHYQLKLIVALLTAWMSGTLFNPTWKNGRNLFADSFMLKFQMLYCRAFAQRYANRPEIIAWEFGNEQNCADSCASTETAWVWMHALRQEVKIHDPHTPFASGMHGLVHCPNAQAPWGIADSADAVDWLTTHPYPPFTPGCFMESPCALRANMHAVIQSRYYADVGQRPTLCEETGAMGQSTMSDNLMASYLRMRLYSLLANQVFGCLWWCYSDFQCGKEYPYRDVQMENDGLGLTRIDGTPKPAAQEMSKFRRVLDQLGGVLPEQKIEAAILVPDLTENFLNCLNCYALCVQSGFTPRFVCPERDDLAGYKLYLIPSVSGSISFSAEAWDKICRQIHDEGGVLYVSSQGASLRNLSEVFGIVEQEKLPMPNKKLTVNFACGFSCDVKSSYYNLLHEVANCEIRGNFDDGTPALLRHRYGKGLTCFLAVPLEASLAATNYALEETAAWKLYAELKDLAQIRRPVEISDPYCESYWNPVSEKQGYLTVINHRRTEISLELKFRTAPRKIQPLNPEIRVNHRQIELGGLHAGIVVIDW